MYNVNLEVFQGPLDLLLHLIEKMEIDIHNVPIAKLTDSYLEHIASIDEISIESAEEYIVMASTLIHIKSKRLLPVVIAEEDNYQEDDLIQQLIDYKNYKELCSYFEQLHQERAKLGDKLGEEVIVDSKLMNMPVDKIYTAFKRLMDSKKFEERGSEIRYRREVSLDNIRDTILNFTSKNKQLRFSELITNYDTKEEVVASFICILDMIKNNLILCREIGEELFLEQYN